MTADLPIDILPDVGRALAAAEPVVALESTIITHGMPYPQNFNMASGVETVIRNEGATPATLAVLEGRIKVGLSDDDRADLAKTKGARKVSRADLAYAIARGETAGTTVAATMMIAAMVGIKVFATGGIGGVHKGAEQSFDISADLIELARTNVIVVAAGAKAILDIPKTLEMLETNGVPVIGFQTDDMPAFWSRTSGLAAPLRADNAREIANFQRKREALAAMLGERDNGPGGMLVANPISSDAEIPQAEMMGFIDRAQADLEQEGITGKDVTPFLLGRLVEITGGRSLRSNIALVRNNAKIAAQIAVALASR
ncbi:MAG: pseudouridine-5'-phosphate glycosidase [Pseudomonadota bacterium]